MKMSLKYHVFPNSVFSLMNRFILPVLQHVRNPVFPFFFFPSTGTEILEMLWAFLLWVGFLGFFFKTNYFVCQITILGKEEISKKGSVYSQSSKQNGTTKVICS